MLETFEGIWLCKDDLALKPEFSATFRCGNQVSPYLFH